MAEERETLESVIRGMIREELARAGITPRPEAGTECRVYVAGVGGPELIAEIVGMTTRQINEQRRRRS